MQPTDIRGESLRRTEEWIEAARSGDREAIGEALEGCRQYLRLVADRELGRDLRAKEGASDLVQQAFLEAHRDFDQFRGRTEEDLRAWLRAILRNDLGHLADRYRRTGKREIGREVAIDDKANEGLRKSLAGDEDSVMTRAILGEQETALRVAMERLPKHHWKILNWRHREGRSFEEIGRRLGCSGAAARKTWRRVIGRLQQELGCGIAR